MKRLRLIEKAEYGGGGAATSSSLVSDTSSSSMKFARANSSLSMLSRHLSYSCAFSNSIGERMMRVDTGNNLRWGFLGEVQGGMCLFTQMHRLLVGVAYVPTKHSAMPDFIQPFK